MLKKIDKLILKAFVNPFLVTFSVLVFIFLTQFLLKYVEELVGKNLGWEVFAELFLLFGLTMVPNVLPLSVLLASLMTFGNLGEHRELTAIKSAGISLIRIIQPVFIVVFLISVADFFFVNYAIPKINLKAWGLMYDIKVKKLALDIKPGKFYYDLPNYTVKVGSRDKDGKHIEDVIIYDHTENRGNVKLILAKRGIMYTILNDSYLVLELENGENFTEVVDNNPKGLEFVRNKFGYSKMVFSLSSFSLSRTDLKLFVSNRLMRNVAELNSDVDSLSRVEANLQNNFAKNIKGYYPYEGYQPAPNTPLPDVSRIIKRQDTANANQRRETLSYAAGQSRNLRSYTKNYASQLEDALRSEREYSVYAYSKYSLSAACLVLFLIGAPLGAIIKKGGLGFPVIISIIFFIIFYVLTTNFEKWAKEGQITIVYGMWLPNTILFVFGAFFMLQARNDASILEVDFYKNILDVFRKKTKLPPNSDLTELDAAE